MSGCGVVEGREGKGRERETVTCPILHLSNHIQYLQVSSPLSDYPIRCVQCLSYCASYDPQSIYQSYLSVIHRSILLSNIYSSILLSNAIYSIYLSIYFSVLPSMCLSLYYQSIQLPTYLPTCFATYRSICFLIHYAHTHLPINPLTSPIILSFIQGV